MFNGPRSANAQPGSRMTLSGALQASFETSDLVSLALVVPVHLAVVLRGDLADWDRAMFLYTAWAHFAALLLVAAAPALYRRWRLPIIVGLRAADTVLLNGSIDALHILQPTPPLAPAASGASGALAPLYAALPLYRAVVLLLVGVCELQSITAGAVGFQMPPLLHLPLQVAAVGVMTWRATDSE